MSLITHVLIAPDVSVICPGMIGCTKSPIGHAVMVVGCTCTVYVWISGLWKYARIV